MRSQGKTPEEVKTTLKPLKEKNRGKVVDVSYRLGTQDHSTPEWLVATEKSKLPQPDVFAFPAPARGEGIIMENFSFLDQTYFEIYSAEFVRLVFFDIFRWQVVS